MAEENNFGLLLIAAGLAVGAGAGAYLLLRRQPGVGNITGQPPGSTPPSQLPPGGSTGPGTVPGPITQPPPGGQPGTSGSGSQAPFSLAIQDMDPAVPIGGYVHASLVITNRGQAPATALVSGETLLDGVHQGTWTHVTTPTLMPGQQMVVPVLSAGGMDIQFSGRILTARFSVDSWPDVQATGQFAVIPPEF